MSSLFQRHPEQDLVGYLDGEVSARQAENVDQHLKSCAQCRAELDELRNTLAECVRYQEVRKAQASEAPQPWRDLYRDFSRIDESLAHPSLLVRLTRPLGHSGALRWSFVSGLAVLIVLMSLNQLRQAPSVQAASILRKAVQVAEKKVRPAYRIRVRTSRQQQFTRLPGVQTALMDVAAAQAVGSMFQAAHFDWNDPLSARAFEQWRDQQVHKADEVSTVANPAVPSENFTQIRTIASEGDLAAATITLDTQEYPVNERLEFRDKEWVELSEISETSTESGGRTVAHVETPGRAAEPPSRPAAFTPGSSASISDELQVLSALNGIGADLGEQVEVSLSDGRVKVLVGEGIPQRRQSAIRDVVSALPNVEVAVIPATPAAAPPVSGTPSATAASVIASALQTRLEKQLGGHAQLEHFSAKWLDLDDGAMDHVYAVHRLAQKFPAEEEAQLSPNDLSILHDLTRKHTTVLIEKVGEMEKLLGPAMSALGGAPSSVRYTDRAAWQPAAEDVYTNARRVEVLMSQMLGMTPGAASTNALPSELLTSLKELHANLDQCQKFLAAK